MKAGIFTGVYARMTSIAGKAGMMDEMMGRIADECEEEVDEKLSSMIAVLEPTLVIILSVIVGTILLSVMLPLLGIMSGLLGGMLCGEKKERERFYHGKQRHHFGISVCPFCCLYVSAVLFFSGFERLSDTTRRRQKESLEKCTLAWCDAVLCAGRTHYPETLDDLTENCGIQYDKKQFFIDYQIAGANILPDITVIER